MTREQSRRAREREDRKYTSGPSRTIWGQLPPVHKLRSLGRTICGIVPSETWHRESKSAFEWNPCRSCKAGRISPAARLERLR